MNSRTSLLVNNLPEKKKEADNKSASKEVLAFKNGCRLILEQRGGNEVVQLMSHSGEIAISIHMKEEGPVIRLTGASVELQATKKISFESPSIELNAQEIIKISSKGDYHQEIEGDVHSAARIQHIKADLGNVNIEANDDVRLNGERVKLNCTD